MDVIAINPKNNFLAFFSVSSMHETLFLGLSVEVIFFHLIFFFYLNSIQLHHTIDAILSQQLISFYY